jgi:hypothetical protein
VYLTADTHQLHSLRTNTHATPYYHGTTVYRTQSRQLGPYIGIPSTTFQYAQNRTRNVLENSPEKCQCS